MSQYLRKYRFEVISVLLLWAILCTVYFLSLTHLLAGNHDWHYMRFGTKLSSGLWEGRFTQFIPPALLTKGQILPVWGLLLGFLFLAMAAVQTALLFSLPKRYAVLLPFGGLILLHPYFLTQMYYVYLMPSFCLWYFLCVTAVRLIFTLRLRYEVLAVIFFVICFGGYIGSLELVLTLILGRFLIDVLADEANRKKLFYSYFRSSMAVLAALFIFYLVFLYIRAAGYIAPFAGNTKVAPVRDIFLHLVQKTAHPWQMFFSPFPYLPKYTGYLSLIFVGAVLIFAYRKHKLPITAGVFWLFGYALYATAFLSPFDSVFRLYRLHCYSVPFFAAILYAVVWRYGKPQARNAVWVVSIVLIFFYARADFEGQKIWLLGNATDEKTADRIRERLLPKLDMGKHYRLITVGGLNGRWKAAGFSDDVDMATERELYRELYGYTYYIPEFADSGLFLYEAINPIWGTARDFNYFVLESEFITEDNRDTAEAFSKEYGADKPLLKKAVEQLEPYPDFNAFFIGKKDIVVMLGSYPKEKDFFLEYLNEKL